jgi:hypothetical protein
MSGLHSVFCGFRVDQHPIQIVNGMVIYSEGVGSMCFLSTYGYHIIIHDVLYVPHLSTSLFSSNKFARENHLTYQEVLEYLRCKWVNRHTGVVKFSVTIRSNNLTYLDWRVEPHLESTCMSLGELQA